MPKMGESIQEGKILRWAKKIGDKVEKDETILEISTDKVDSEIPSPVGGILLKILVQEQETVPVGTVIAMMETDASVKVEASPADSVSHKGSSPQTPQTAPAPVTSMQSSSAPAAISSRGGNGDRFYSPLVRTIAEKEGISPSELDRIAGSGTRGRVTKNDLLSYLSKRLSQPAPEVLHREFTMKPADARELAKKYPPPRYEILQMDNVQQKMAEHMVRSVSISPHVQAIDEIDVTAIVAYRNKHAEGFEKREGFKLTFTPFFCYAIVQALKEFPLVNSSVEGDKVILKKFINLGMAVAAPSGLIVPNVKNAEEKSFLGLARAVNDLALRTRNKKLKPDEIQDGTFTITNYGVFGNIIGIPIINQPQLAILGIGAVKKRPVVVTDQDGNDMIAIRSLSYFTLSFDHRILDGAIGGQFLARVKSNIENFDFSRVQ